ncbi:MAG TPA: glycosyltransferase [Stellaceae bacterium]|nr:glycosyltransferase [Stellaceae bacterium]
MAGEILLAVSALLLLLAAHPFVTYPLSLRLLRRSRPAEKPSEESAPAGFAICVCAYNEEAVIVRKVENMLDLRRRYGALEILVYVDAATDRTAQLLERFRGEITVIVSPRRFGKTHGMNLLVERATAPIIVFTDANVMVGEDSLAALGEAFRDPDVGCVCGHLVYTNAAGTPTASVGSIYWRLEEQIKRLESEEGAAMGADGSLFAVRRHLHRPVPSNLIDDMYLSLSVLCDGFRVVRAEQAVAYEESVTVSGEEFRRKIRIACQAFNVHRELWPSLRQLPRRVVYMYVSHKLLRWLAIYNLALAGVTAAAGLALLGVPLPAILLAGVAGAALLWGGHARHVSPLAQIGEILVALLGAGIGVAESVRGKQYQTWTPATSIRQLPQD